MINIILSNQLSLQDDQDLRHPSHRSYRKYSFDTYVTQIMYLIKEAIKKEAGNWKCQSKIED